MSDLYSTSSSVEILEFSGSIFPSYDFEKYVSVGEKGMGWRNYNLNTIPSLNRFWEEDR